MNNDKLNRAELVRTIKVDLSKYDNSWYQPGNKLKRAAWFVMNVLFFNNSMALLNGFKIFLLRVFGANVGKGVVIKPSVNIKYPWKLTIGDYCWIGEDVWIDNLTTVTIGSNCCLSQGAMLLTGNHDFSKETFDLQVKPITLEDGVWIGAKSVVCPGIYCESHTVLAVSSVATTRLIAFNIYQGNPAAAVKIRSLNQV